MRPELPIGTVTFLFTDVEGSTKLLHELGDEAYADALATHRRLLREAFIAHGGVEVDTQGDAFFFAFRTAPGALDAAADARGSLARGPIRVRMGIHTGTPYLSDEGYIGADVHRAARIAAAGHGGQILVSSSTASLVDGHDLRGLGEHRLKDLSAPEPLYQLGDDDFPPLNSLHQTNLPVPATPFLGREGELSEVHGLLARDDMRLLTLTGPGGTGKTRLALQAAGASAEAFPAGVWWVSLAPIRDAGVVVDAAAQALGATSELSEHIADRRLLLLFDNFEHVVAAAPDIARLLDKCPQLTVLVTSREPLRLNGEWEYVVDPLREAEAVELFELRARAAHREFVADGAVREICERLDNLPLAIELAAARVKVLSPSALLERLERRLPVLTGGPRDAPERQRTLRATLEWSHDLLSDDEQQLLSRLSVFAGGCTFDAAEAVCDADLDSLASLVDKSLVRQTADRFWMLEIIREFAEERLADAGEADEIGRRHGDYFLALAESAEPHLRSESTRGRGQDWLTRLDAERDNMRVAFDRFDARGDDESLVRLAAALARFWEERLHFAEGGKRVARALRSAQSRHARAKLALSAATFAVHSGDPAGGQRLAEEAAALHRELGDTWGTADSLWALGYCLAERGEWERARDIVGESRSLFTAVGDDHAVLLVTRTFAWTHVELGDLEHARTLHEENLARARALGNRIVEAITLGALAMIAADEGRLGDAFSLLQGNMRIFQDLGNEIDIGTNLGRIAYALSFTEDLVTATRLVGAARSLFDEFGVDLVWVARMNEETLSHVRAQLDEDAVTAALEEGRALTADEAIELALRASEAAVAT